MSSNQIGAALLLHTQMPNSVISEALTDTVFDISQIFGRMARMQCKLDVLEAENRNKDEIICRLLESNAAEEVKHKQALESAAEAAAAHDLPPEYLEFAKLVKHGIESVVEFIRNDAAPVNKASDSDPEKHQPLPPYILSVIKLKNQARTRWQRTRDPRFKIELNALQRKIKEMLNEFRNESC